MVKDELIKISLQFFGEGADDGDFDEYEDDWDEEDKEPDEDEDENGADGGDDNHDSEDEGDEGGEDAPENDDDGDKGEAVSETDALMAELKALGYEGDDLKSITASMKKKREDAESAERRAANKEGKEHVKSGKPSRGANGDGMSGFTRRDIKEMQAAIGKGCTEERARRALEKRIRATAR